MRALRLLITISLVVGVSTGTFLVSPRTAQAATEYDVKPYFGGSLAKVIESVIIAYTGGSYLEHVTVDKLTIDTEGTIRSQVTVQWAQYQFVPGIPGVRKEQRWTIWSLRLVHRSTRYITTYEEVRTDIGACHGCINTEGYADMIREGTSKWMADNHESVLAYRDGRLDRYGLVCIRNHTDLQLNYALQWSSNSWQNHSVSAGYLQTHWWNYEAGSYSSPELRIRFDADLTGGTSYTVYLLSKYRAATTDCSDAKVYTFRRSGNSRLELYADD